MSASNYLENRLLDSSLGVAAFTAPGNVYVALFTADPTDTGSFASEVAAATGYSRQIATFGSAVNGSTAITSNITFPTATANWGIITHIGICDNATRAAGNMLYYATALVARNILTGDAYQIGSGNLTVSLD